MKTEDLLAHEAFVRSLARRLLSDEHRSSDITQQAWLAAIERPPTSKGVLRSWLSKVTRNLAVKRIRGDARRIERERAAAIPEGIPSTDEIVAIEETRREVVAAIFELDESQRSVILLRFFQDLPWEEVAKRVHAPVETARSRLKRGLAKLREKLDKKYGDRSAWCLALAPLAGIKVGGVAAVGTATSTLGTISGSYLMAVKVKVILAAIIVCCSVVVLWQALPENASDGSSPVVLNPPSIEEGAVLAEAGLEAFEETKAGQEKVRITPTGSNDDTIVVTERKTVQVDGRFVDATGRPLEGVHLMRYGAEVPVVTSGPDGFFKTVVPLSNHVHTGVEIYLYAKKNGFRKKHFGAKATHASIVHLGDIELASLDGLASISGVVVNEPGMSVSKGWVGWTVREIDEEDVDSCKLTGDVNDPMDRRGTAARVNVESDGSFRLEGINPGRGRVWVTNERSYYTYSDVLDVAANEVKSGLQLGLEPVPRDRLVEGVVLDPTGSPVPGAKIKIIGWMGKNSCSMSKDESDSEGKFVYVLGRVIHHTFEVHSDNDLYDAVRVDNIKEGTRELVIQFTKRHFLRLRFATDDNRTLDEIKVRIQEQGHFSSSAEKTFRRKDFNDEGLLQVPIPRSSFSVKVKALGYEEISVGPFESGSIPDIVDVSLESHSGIDGAVSVEGRPIEGARMSICKAPNVKNSVQTVNGFICRSIPRKVDTTKSDSNGSFTLWIRESGFYYVRAEAVGYAVSEIGPIEFEQSVGKTGLELSLTPGGSIEGYVNPLPNESLAGRVVAISRGDGFTWSTRTDESGYYCFNHLTAGPWQVEFRENEINVGGGMTARSWWVESPPAFPWSCIVKEGETTRYNVDAGTMQTCIEGRLELFGLDTNRWEARLTSARSEPIAESTVDSDGNFALKVPVAGTYSLVLTRELQERGQIVIKDSISAKEGANKWSCSLSFGALEIKGLPQFNDGTKLYHFSRGDGFQQTYVRIQPDEMGNAVLSAVPVGGGTVRRMGWNKTEKRSVDEVLGEVEVPAGGKATLELK